MDDVLDMIRQARAKGWWKQYGISDKDFVALETAATRISNYEATLVPGLLQTAVFTSGSRQRAEDWIANQPEVHLTRQERLTGEEHPLELDNELPTVTLRVLPASAFSPEAAHGGFSVLDFPQPGHPSMCHAMHALGDERQDKSEFVEPARLRFAHLRSMADPDESVALVERGNRRTVVKSRRGVTVRWRRSSFSGGQPPPGTHC